MASICFGLNVLKDVSRAAFNNRPPLHLSDDKIILRGPV